VTLHAMLDELLADFAMHHPPRVLSETNLIELIEWSYQQTIEPEVIR
jgi:hypothetical protein